MPPLSHEPHADPRRAAMLCFLCGCRSGLGGETSGLYRANKPAPLQVHENTELGGITRGIPEKYPIPVQMSNSKSHSMTYIESPGHSYSSVGPDACEQVECWGCDEPRVS